MAERIIFYKVFSKHHILCIFVLFLFFLFRENRLRDVKELAKLTCLKSLVTLVVSGNDFGSNPDHLRSRLLELLPGLERINKVAVSYNSELKEKVLNGCRWRWGEEQESEMEWTRKENDNISKIVVIVVITPIKSAQSYENF